MGAIVEGLDKVQRHLAAVDRKLTRDQQKVIRAIARQTLVPAIKSQAPSAVLAKAVTARNGKAGAVVVGPRGGRRGVWYRHLTIGGAEPHPLAPKKMRAMAGGLTHPVSGEIFHPGTRANPFVARGTRIADGLFMARVAEAFYSDKPAPESPNG